MKARNKFTGKEITILGISKEYGTVSYIADGVLCQENFASGALEIIDDSDPVDWSAFRREAAKDILSVLIEKASNVYEFESLNKEIWCQQAIEWADELIKQIKEK